jgi:hypothetical protein
MIQRFAHNLILLASREEMHRVWGRFDHERPGISTKQIAIAIAVVALLVVVGIAWRTLKRRMASTFSSDSSVKLFRELCAAHGITRSDRRLLKQLAAASGVADPATLFVEPRFFDLPNLPGEMKASATALRALNETLFG